ncbi:MAG: ATP-binding cassette domain-containing protein [Puniceicoccales bacterium]|jgi:phospholipid/cholesterol/gamma-HCH transport system ATP-binding protein|nr:ATP-binding cassette domain-containing protein [Puniceicoccales bacterium]
MAYPPPLPAVAVHALAIGHGERPSPLVEGIEFSVAPGEIFAIIGCSGCGKSTLLRTMVGLLPLLAGTVLLFGKKMVTVDCAGHGALTRNFSVLFQGGALWTDRTLGENVALPLLRRGGFSPKEVRDLVDCKLSLVGLGAYADFYPHEISGGMARRAALARALALDPPLLFLDEPTSGLDPVAARRLDRLVAELCSCQGMAAVVVSHDLAEIGGIVTRAAFLDANSGTMLDIGSPAALARSPHGAVREFFCENHANPQPEETVP